MKPYGPLMVEHRLIERMVVLLKKELDSLMPANEANTAFIFAAVDFLRNYADKVHHGKEEDILFRKLAEKTLRKGHREIMKTLIEEHSIARTNVQTLFEAAEKYAKNDLRAAAEIRSSLKALVELYPQHIAKEDRQFFIPAMAYFSEDEQQQMLAEFFEFDKNVIHQKYKELVGKYEGSK
jgi:hemerythrin-like domain-containing protein